MKNIYFSIFFCHYKLIQLGKSGKLWSAASSSIFMALIITLCLHFTIGTIIGRKLMIVYHSTIYGSIFLIFLMFFNLFIFVKGSKYLVIETEIEKNKYKYKKAIITTILYFVFAFTLLYFTNKTNFVLINYL